MNVALIGMRGVGKSNVSRRLGFLTKRPVLSTDVLIEYESGQSLPAFVAAHGWREFRDLEAAVVDRVARMDGVIVDCGGGVIVDLDPDTDDEVFSERKVSALRAAGPVVWLRGDIDQLAAKVAGDETRPALSARTDAAELMRRREPFYERAADHVVDVTGQKRSVMALDLSLTFAADLRVSPEVVADLRHKRARRD